VGLSGRILIGLLLGVATGVFFGERAAVVEPLGRAFVQLLQMSVLPYLVVSLVAALGSLTLAQARMLAARAGVVLLVLWGLTLTAVALSPLAFPEWETASFFSTSLVEPRSEIDFVQLYIPANPFNALASNVVPSVVLFSVALALALMRVEGKQGLMHALSATADALGKITSFVVRLAPFGVFAIAANAAGTLDVADVGGLQVYVALHAVLALLIALWAIPGLIAAVTPFGHGEILRFTREALVTAFATGNLFVVLAVLGEQAKVLMRERASDRTVVDEVVDVVVPTAFNLPSAGKLLTLCFVLFAGWLSGFPVAPLELPTFLVSGVASFFGSTLVGIPFLLEMFRIPSDTFQLFLVVDNVIGSRFGALLAASHMVGLSVLSAAGAVGLLELRVGRIALWAGVTLGLLVASLTGIRLAFEALGHEYEKYDQFVEMRLMSEPVKHRVVLEPSVAPPEAPPGPALQRIRERGLIRVAYKAEALPFAFRNNAGELVGFDVEMAHALARELGVEIEFVLMPAGEMVRWLEAGYVDIVMSATAVTTERLAQVAFSDTLLDETLAFVVRDHLVQKFSSRASVRGQDRLRLGMLDVPYYEAKVRRYLPQAELVKLRSPREFFQKPELELDAFVYSAAAGSAWTLIYPEFAVAVPQPDLLKVPLAYPVRMGDEGMVRFLNRWLELKRKDHTIGRLYDHWILGRGAAREGPRWSVMRDVLGWGE
jgi:Na+/H+-dicarboxylate symporter